MSEEFNDDMSSVDDSFNDSSSEIESDIEDSASEAEAEANEIAEEQASEMEAEAQEAQSEAEAEANEIAEEQAAEMEAEAQETQAEVDEITVEQSSKEADISDYKVMIDGEEFDPNKNPLEGTKELIGHSELDDAYWANDVHSAEKMKEVADKMQAGDYSEFDFAGPMNDMNEIQYESNKNEYEINAFRKVNQWSMDSYTEEYNPEDFN